MDFPAMSAAGALFANDGWYSEGLRFVRTGEGVLLAKGLTAGSTQPQ